MNKTNTALSSDTLKLIRKNCGRYFYVRADKVLRLRKLLDKLGSVKGLMNEEKGIVLHNKNFWSGFPARNDDFEETSASSCSCSV